MAENVIKYLDLNGLKTLYGVVDGKIKVEADRAAAAEKALSDKIDAMDLTDTAETGKFITAVHQTDGKVTIERGGVSASMVTATNVEAGDGTVAITGATVEDQIKSLGQTLKTVEGNAAKYKVVKLTDEEVTALGDANVKEAYRVVSYVGADAVGTTYTPVGEPIKIYKDGNLKDAKLGDNQELILTYTKADGTDAVVQVDFAAIAFNTEFQNGLQVAENGVVSVKIDANSEGFLTVGADGVKLAGVQNAIDTAVAAKNVSAEGDAYITANANGNNVSVSADVQPLTVNKNADADSTIAGVEQSLVDGAEVATKVAAFTNARISEEIAKLDATIGEAAVAKDKHVAVQVVEADGKITAVNVNESDIASAKTLADVKKEQEANTAAISGAINESAQSITLGGKTLHFIAFTEQEIQDAAKK